MTKIARVQATAAAHDWINKLAQQHGPLMFHQSGGCCDGSSPMCFPRDDFKIGEQDILLGHISDTPFYIGGAQYVCWQHTQLIIDVVPGRGSGFSLEAPEGIRFITRSRVFTNIEMHELQNN